VSEEVASHTRALQELCASCGACCDGTIFSEGKLEADEAASLVGLVTLRRPGAFALPCPSHALPSGCTIYDRRPAACRRYRCKLHRDLAEGRVAPNQALAKVRRIRELSREIAARLPPAPGPGLGIWARLEASVGASPAAQAARDPAFALDVAELSMRLTRDLGVEDPGGPPPD
jgi:hypothetical protein